MKKTILFSIICAGIFMVIAGCLMRAPSGTIYILDNNYPPRPVLAPSTVVVPPPQPAVVVAPPPIVVVENVPDVYYVQSTPNMFSYTNLWYYCYGGYWYRSSSHHGPWISIGIEYVPEHFHRIPEHHFKHAGPPPRYDRNNDNRDHNDRGGHQDRGNHGRDDRR
ncbi:MAG: hypothetical protein V1709_01190 [Planctomycetota bacterium]